MATLHKGKEDRWEAAGDATEIALQVFAHKLGHGKPHLTHPKKKGTVASQALSPVTTRTSEHGPAKTKVALDGHYEIVIEHPFDSSVKRMSTVSPSSLVLSSSSHFLSLLSEVSLNLFPPPRPTGLEVPRPPLPLH